MEANKIYLERLNPYSNGTMYLIEIQRALVKLYEYCLNPYSNGTMYLMRCPLYSRH